MEAVYSIHQAMKAELGTSDLLMVVVVLGPDPQVSTYPSWSTIQQYVRQMAGVNPLVGIADASNLAAIPTNNIHITAASAVTLGQRIAASAFALGQGKGFW